MPRLRTKHAQISSEKVRKSTFKRRLDSVFKKANELSILCGVEVVIIVHDRNEGDVILWPSQEQVTNGVVKFLTIPERERLKKMVLQEKFLMDKLKDRSEDLLKLQKKNEETEMGFLMNQLIDGTSINELDTRQLNGLSWFVNEKLKKLRSRNDELDEQQPSRDGSRHYQPSLPMMTMATTEMRGQEGGDLASSSIAALMGDMGEDKWFGFGDTMSGTQNNLGLPGGANGAPESSEAVRPFIEGNQQEVPGEYGKVWPTIFSP